MKMPFGKYKGQEIADIEDLGYLRWLKDNIDLKGGLKQQVERMLDLSAGVAELCGDNWEDQWPQDLLLDERVCKQIGE